MIVNVQLDFNPETNECKVIGTEVTTKKKSIAVENTDEPTIALDSNKYVLNEAAAELLHVKWGDRISIQYQAVSGVTYPIIGSSAAFGVGTGNKLTKGLTVSCRGTANDVLSKYGSLFTLTEMQDQKGLFVMVGNAPTTTESSEDIEIVEDENSIDLPEVDDTKQSINMMFNR